MDSRRSSNASRLGVQGQQREDHTLGLADLEDTQEDRIGQQFIRWTPGNRPSPLQQ